MKTRNCVWSKIQGLILGLLIGLVGFTPGCMEIGPDHALETFESGEPINSSAGLGVDESYATVEAPLYMGFGYYLTTGWDKTYVSGCVKTIANRLAIRFNKGSSQVFDAHAAVYGKNGKLCFGLYESVSGWTKCTCSPTKQQIQEFIYQAALAAGVAAGIAWSMAKISAPLILPLLAL